MIQIAKNFNKPFLNIGEAAALTGYSESYIRHQWPEWKEKRGVRVFKGEGKGRGHLLFKTDTLVRMMETSWEVK